MGVFCLKRGRRRADPQAGRPRVQHDSLAIDEELKVLEFKMNQLRREYEQYFLGTRPREPALLRGEVQKIVVVLSNTAIQNTALRFKFSSMCSRYQAFKRQWDETLRKIEAGTYERHQFKAKMHEKTRGQGLGTPARDAETGAGEPEDLYQSYVDARLACGQSVKGLTRAKLDGVLEKQRVQLRKRYGSDSDFRIRVAVEDGKVKLKASKQEA